MSENKWTCTRNCTERQTASNPRFLCANSECSSRRPKEPRAMKCLDGVTDCSPSSKGPDVCAGCGG